MNKLLLHFLNIMKANLFILYIEIRSFINCVKPLPFSVDGADMSILKVLFNRLVADHMPDEDSVLGFTPEENADEPEPDLSQPYISFIVDSDEETTDAGHV